MDDIAEPSVKSAIDDTTEALLPKRAIWRAFTAIGYLAAMLLLLLLVLACFPSYLKPGTWPSGWDMFGHLFKIDSTAKMLAKYGTYVDWSDDWYAGYHPFLFYPPLSYVIPVILRLFFNMSLTARISVLAGIWTAAVSGYVLGLSIQDSTDTTASRLLPFVPAVLYGGMPAVVGLVTVAGEFADFWAASLAPLAAAFFFYWLIRQRFRYLLGLSITLSVVFLMHGHIATPLAVGMAVGAWLFDWYGARQSRSKQETISFRSAYRRFLGVLLSIALFVGLTAIWWLPYFLESPVLALPDLIPLSKAALPLWAFLNKKELVGAPRYLGVSALFLAGFGAIVGDRRKVIALTGMGCAGLVLYLGPSWTAYAKIPVLGLIFSERAIPTIAIAMAGLALLGLKAIVARLTVLLSSLKTTASVNNKLLTIFSKIVVPAALTVIAILALLADNAFIFKNSETVNISSEIKAVSGFLSKQPRSFGERVAFLSTTAESAYSPTLSGWPIIEGYLVQGSRLSSEVEWVTTYESTKGDLATFRQSIKRWNIRFLVVHNIGNAEVAAVLNHNGSFTKVFSTRYYTVFKYKDTPGYLAPVRSIHVIGDPRYIKETLTGLAQAGQEQLVYSEGGVEQLQTDPTGNFVFPGGPIPEDLERLLLDKVKGGAKAIVVLDGSNISTFLGVKVAPASFLGTLPVVNRNHSLHSVDASFQGSSWDTVSFDGLDEVWLSSGNKVLAGTKRLGAGNVLFVGFNAFYHSAYKNDEWEKRELVSMCQRLLSKQAPGSFKFNVQYARPGVKSFAVTTSKPAPVLISSGWSPYWQASIDGKPAEIYRAQNMMLVDMPSGSHQLELQLNQWSFAKIAGLGITLLAFALTVAGFIRLSSNHH